MKISMLQFPSRLPMIFPAACVLGAMLLAACGSHIEEDRVPDALPAKKDDGGAKDTKNDKGSDGRATDDVRQAAQPQPAGQDEGTCGVQLSLKADGNGAGASRYVLVAKVSPECAEGNDILVSLKSAATIRPIAELLNGQPCEESGVEEYDVMCRVTGVLAVKNGEIAIPVRIEDKTAPAGGRGDTRIDVWTMPAVTAFAEFIPTVE